MQKKYILELSCDAINQDTPIAFNGIATPLSPKTSDNTQNNNQYMETKAWYQQLISLRDNLEPLKTVVVHPVDALSLQGAIEATKEKLITPILVGPKHKINEAAHALDVDISHYEIISTEHSHAAAEMAVKLVKEGRAEAIMKGKLHTDELMEPIIHKTNGLRTQRRISHVFSMKVPHYHKPLFLTDAVVNIAPTLQDKKDIVQNAINLFIRLGLGHPKVAILSAVETVNEKIPSTLDATALCKMAERGQIVGGILDGPLALDNAISKFSAEEKGIYSSVAGDADILVTPDLVSGNLLYKQMTFLSDVESAGIVLGARVPIILTSRSSHIISRKASCAMALLYARSGEKL